MDIKNARLTENELINVIHEMRKELGSYKAVAAHIGISNTYLSDIVQGWRVVSAEVAQKLGYRKVIEYEPILRNNHG